MGWLGTGRIDDEESTRSEGTLRKETAARTDRVLFG